jgi:cytochrome c5
LQSLFVSIPAIDLDEATRTVVADPAGKTVAQNKLNEAILFNATCGACHLGGITKPNVGLD